VHRYAGRVRTWRSDGDPLQDLDRALSRAAEALRIPYRTAWERIKATESEIGFRLLDSESGGLDGGGSSLTPQARDLCRRFRRVSGGIQEVVTRRFAAEFGDGSDGT
jgi:molybdate transport system regulatory protein